MPKQGRRITIPELVDAYAEGTLCPAAADTITSLVKERANVMPTQEHVDALEKASGEIGREHNRALKAERELVEARREHVAALEGLARDFEKRAAAEVERAGKLGNLGLVAQTANCKGAADAFTAAANVIRREVRNLIEQGGAE